MSEYNKSERSIVTEIRKCRNTRSQSARSRDRRYENVECEKRKKGESVR